VTERTTDQEPIEAVEEPAAAEPATETLPTAEPEAEPTQVGEYRGWTVLDHGDNKLTATKDGHRQVTCTGGPNTEFDVVETRLYEAIRESEELVAAAAEAGVEPSVLAMQRRVKALTGLDITGAAIVPAGGGAIVHAARIIVPNGGDESNGD
jgi:hypothetical protein